MRVSGLCIGLLAVGMIVVLSGCSGGALPGGTNSGTRTVTSVPGAGYVIFETEFEATVNPTDSDLLRALDPTYACSGDAPLSDLQEDVGVQLLYEVGTAGAVASVTSIIDFDGQQICEEQALTGFEFAVEEGCLVFSQDVEDEEDPIEDDDDPTDVETSPLCGDTGIALTRNGPVYADETDEEYICVTVTVSSQSLNCSQANGVWTQSGSVTITYTAQGSLDNVSVAAWQQLCGDGTTETVDISQGDSVTATITSTTTFSMSQTPEELGCTEEEQLPDFEDIDPEDFDFDFGDLEDLLGGGDE
jgi:hypothetical protein